MPLPVRLKPVESLLFRGDVVAVGKFRCPSTHPLFRDSGPCSHPTFVFPRTMTQIRYAGGPTVLGSPNSVLFYNEETILHVLTRVIPSPGSALRSEPPSPTSGRWRRNASGEKLMRVKEIIADDVSRNISLRALARDVGLSPFALCRAFRRVTGQTLTSYRDTLRLRIALDRLRDGAADLTRLALDLGYSSHSHFTARFRRCFGMTPSAFRASS